LSDLGRDQTVFELHTPEFLAFGCVEGCAWLDEQGSARWLPLERRVFDDLNHSERLTLIDTLDRALEASAFRDDVALLLHLRAHPLELLEERLLALELEHTKLLLADRLDLVKESAPLGLDPALAHRADLGSKVDLRGQLDALVLVGAMVDALFRAGALEREVGGRSPGGPGVHEPGLLAQLPDLGRAAAFRVLAIGLLEPLLLPTLESVVTALADHDVGVWVMTCALMDRHRVGQSLGSREVLGERLHEFALGVLVELARNRNLDLPIDHPVGALVGVHTLPERFGRVGPRGKVLGPRVHHLSGVARELSCA
jgi:hypothetical protein